MPRITIPKTPGLQISDEAGYKYVETSEEWKTLCAVLPCFSAMHWPDYDTKIIEDKIDGRDVVIQLWKGTCQQFLGLTDWPGGVGAEVGVYVRAPGRPIPALDFLPPLVRPLYTAAAGLNNDHLWWPDPSLKTEIQFVLHNPLTKTPFFAAGPQTSYWRNRWMAFDSVDKYEANHPGKLPRWATELKLTFRINDKQYEAW
jgi:hypothetical protein